MAADPGPLIPNRGLRKGADARAVVAEQLEVEGVCNFVFTSPWDLGDPLQEGGQRGVGGGGRGRWTLERSARGPERGSRLGLGNRAGTANKISGASTGASGVVMGLGVATACLSTPARSSGSGTWGEVRIAAARMTGTRAKNCREPGGGSSNEAGTALRTALAHAGAVDWSPRSLVAMDRRGGKALMKLCSLTASACRCAAADRCTCCRALSGSVRIMSRSRLTDSMSPCASFSSC